MSYNLRLSCCASYGGDDRPQLIGPGPWRPPFLPHLRQLAFEQRFEFLLAHAPELVVDGGKDLTQ
jgi:hypothetical protein